MLTLGCVCELASNVARIGFTLQGQELPSDDSSAVTTKQAWLCAGVGLASVDGLWIVCPSFASLWVVSARLLFVQKPTLVLAHRVHRNIS